MLDKNLKELYEIFNFFNNKFYNGVIEKPVITIQSAPKKGILGWCTLLKVWNDNNTKNSYYEINIVAEYLNRSTNEIIQTLLHEMVHLYNIQNGIKDCSRNGYYHNKNFKNTAEKIGGLVVEKTTNGWSYAQLSDDTKKIINKRFANKIIFNLSKNTFNKNSTDSESNDSESVEKKKKGYIKYICPKCSSIARTTKETNLICGDCKETMIDEDKIDLKES